MKIKSIKVIKGKNKWSESKDKLIHMVLDLGEYEQKPSNKIEGFYERIKEYLPSLKSHRCSIGKTGGFFKRVKEGTWMGHIIEHVALELQTLAGYDTGWGRTRGVKGEKGVYNVVFNYEDEDKGKLAAKEAVNVVKDIINDNNPQIDKIVKKLKSKSLKESIKRILREERFLSRIEEDTKLEKEIKKVIDKLTKDDQFPENFYRFTVNSFIDNTFLTPKEINDGHIGNRTIIVTGLFKKPFSEKDSDKISEVMKRIAPKIKAMFRPFYDEIRLHSTSTIDSHLQSLDYYEEYPVYVPYRYK